MACPFKAQDFEHVLSFPIGLKTIGQSAFNFYGESGAGFIDATQNVIIKIPYTVISLGRLSFAYLDKMTKKVYVEIGE
jgi:hypothetical protein